MNTQLPIQPLSPRALNQRYLRQAVDLLIERAGIPWLSEPAIAFKVTDSSTSTPSSPGMEWMTFTCLPALLGQGPSHAKLVEQYGWIACLRMRPTDPHLPLSYLHLGVWLRGDYQMPIYTPGRVVPGRYPLESFLDGGFGSHLIREYKLVMVKPCSE